MNPIPLAGCVLLAATGANRTWAEPDPPPEPFVPPAHRDTTVRFLSEFERGPIGWPDRNLRVSPDGLHVAVLSEAGDGRKQGSCVVARDGMPGACYDEIPTGCGWISIIFSPDSAHLLWCAKDGDTWRAVMDGQPGIGFAAALTHDGGEAGGPSDPVFHFAVPGRVNFLAALTPPDEDGGGQGLSNGIHVSAVGATRAEASTSDFTFTCALMGDSLFR